MRAIGQGLCALGVLLAISSGATAAGGAGAASEAGGASSEARLPRVTLQEALARALARNPSIALAKAEIARAEALVRQARASWMPLLTGNGTYTRLDDERKRGELVIAGANSESADVTISVPLLQTQGWYQWSHARDNVEVARLSAEEVRRQLALSVARAYLAVLAQQRAIAVSEQARDTARAHLRFAEQRLAGGAGPRLAVVRAAQEVATDEAQLQTAYGALDRAREALGVLLALGGPVDIANQATGLEHLPRPEEAIKGAEKLRPDVRTQEQRVEAARRVVRDSWTDYMPYLSGTFQPFFQNPSSLSKPERGWQAQILLTVPFFDGGLRYGQKRERRAQLDSARASLEALLRQARSEVRAAFAVLRQAEKAMQAAREAAQLAEEAYALANRAYQAGATTNLETIDAARRARDAEVAAVVAEDAVRQARLDLLVASGKFP